MATATKVKHPAVGATVKLPVGFSRDYPATVGADCGAPRGFWVCSTHAEGFQNNMQATSHEDDGRAHLTYWLCTEHGPEVVS